MQNNPVDPPAADANAPSWANPVVELMQQHGIFGLSGSDGCLCADFSLHHTDFHVHCRKSGSGYGTFWGVVIRVANHSMDAQVSSLEEIAREGVRQIQSSNWSGPLLVRFSTYEQDSKQTCIYCGKPRERLRDYLCQSCSTKEVFGEKVVDRYAFPWIEYDEDGDAKLSSSTDTSDSTV